MSRTNSDLPSLPLSLTALQVMGLKNPDQGNWARLRALQYANLKTSGPARIMAHMLAALVTAVVYADSTPMFYIGIWLLGIAAAASNTFRINRSFVDLDRRIVSNKDVRSQLIGVVGIGLAWSTGIVMLLPFGNLSDQVIVWTLVIMLIAGSSATMAAAPLSTVLFAVLTGTAFIATFIWRGEWVLATVTAAYLVGMISATLDSARTYLTARIAEVGVNEKEEVVSLLLREFEDNGADWLWQIDTNRRIVAASPRFAYALGLDPADMEGQSFIRMISGQAWEKGQFPPSLHDLAERLKRRENFSNLLVQVDVDGLRRWWEISGTPIADDQGSFAGYRGVGSDVTERRESDEKIAYLARYDTLTGLPNRLMLIEAMAEALRYSAKWKTRCAFLMIDLDRFKSVNDSLGHQVGDLLLEHVSLRLKEQASDTCRIGRLGGDEFAVVISDASDSALVDRTARQIIDRLSQPYNVNNHVLYIGASIGSAIGPRDGDTVETLMRNADLALYRAKDDGGGIHSRYEPSLHANAEERRKLEHSLRHAVANRELKLNFQPVVDSISEEVVSFEALLRWQSKEHGPVSPVKFIPLAEDTRLIVPIGNWVLLEACRQAVRWPGNIKVAVNVSGEQLLEPGFSSIVVRALADTGLPAHRLEVEVTESIFLRDARTARQTLEEILALGCSVALDDFGTGYSSLGYLRTLRFSTIKVDRSFVTGAAQGSAESLAIIRAVVAMAQSLEMTTTAEGAETAAEVQMIRDLGCDKIQGYFFGRPMEAAEAHALVDRKMRGIAAA